MTERLIDRLIDGPVVVRYRSISEEILTPAWPLSGDQREFRLTSAQRVLQEMVRADCAMKEA